MPGRYPPPGGYPAPPGTPGGSAPPGLFGSVGFTPFGFKAICTS